MPSERPPSVLVAIPCRESLPLATVKSIAKTVAAGYTVVFEAGGGLPNARNEILRQARNQGYRRVLMVDSDMVWHPEHVERLLVAMQTSPHEPAIISGRYYSRSQPHRVHAYRDGKAWPGPERPRWDEAYEVDYVGAGFLLLDVGRVTAIPEPWFDHSHDQGEDAFFCRKARANGLQTWFYPAVTLGHVGTTMFSDPQYDLVRGAGS